MNSKPSLVPATLAPHQDSEQPPDRLIGSNDFCAVLGVNLRTLQRMVAAKQVPQPIRFGARRNKWRWSTVQAYLDRLEQAGEVRREVCA